MKKPSFAWGVVLLAAAFIPSAFAGARATGGNTTNDVNGWRIHTFTNSALAGTFAVTADVEVEVLVVAGGGGGGRSGTG